MGDGSFQHWALLPRGAEKLVDCRISVWVLKLARCDQGAWASVSGEADVRRGERHRNLAHLGLQLVKDLDQWYGIEVVVFTAAFAFLRQLRHLAPQLLVDQNLLGNHFVFLRELFGQIGDVHLLIVVGAWAWSLVVKGVEAEAVGCAQLRDFICLTHPEDSLEGRWVAQIFQFLVVPELVLFHLLGHRPEVAETAVVHDCVTGKGVHLRQKTALARGKGRFRKLLLRRRLLSHFLDVALRAFLGFARRLWDLVRW